MAKPTVAILGASSDRSKFGNKSVRAHLKAGYDVYPVNPNVDTVEGLKAYRTLADVPAGRLNRISVYVPPSVGAKLLPEIQASGAGEVWFNPGSESDEILTRAESMGLNIIRACSIVDVGHSPHEFGE